MTDATFNHAHGDPYHLHGGRPHEGPASKRIVTAYGFWIFILSDMVMFSAFFAAYAVLFKNTAGGPSARDLFDLRNTATETACLLAIAGLDGRADLKVFEHRLSGPLDAVALDAP